MSCNFITLDWKLVTPTPLQTRAEHSVCLNEFYHNHLHVGEPPVEAAANPGGSCIRRLLLSLESRRHLPDRLWTWRLLWAVALECSGNIYICKFPIVLHNPILVIPLNRPFPYASCVFHVNMMGRICTKASIGDVKDLRCLFQIQ